MVFCGEGDEALRNLIADSGFFGDGKRALNAAGV